MNIEQFNKYSFEISDLKNKISELKKVLSIMAEDKTIYVGSDKIMLIHFKDNHVIADQEIIKLLYPSSTTSYICEERLKMYQSKFDYLLTTLTVQS